MGLLDMVRDAFAGIPPANAANPANPRASAGRNRFANGCESCESEVRAEQHSQDSQAFAKPESGASACDSQDSQPSQGYRPDCASAPRTCTTCTHRLRAGTCAVPEQSGLIPAGAGFGIFWPPANHAAACPAWCAKPTSATATRPYKLTAAQGDAAHADPWNDGAVARFKARVADIQRRGVGEDDAEDLAELLHLRDASGDGRHLCVECDRLAGTLAPGLRCRAGLPVWRDLATLLQRCPSFRPAHGACQINASGPNESVQVPTYPRTPSNAPRAKETTA